MKFDAGIKCDICGDIITYKDRIELKGKYFKSIVFKAPDGNYYANQKRRFDMCNNCFEEFKTFINKDK